MVEHPIEGDFRQWVVNAFRQSFLFSAIGGKSLESVIGIARLQEYEVGETMTLEGEPADRFWVILIGEARATVADPMSGEAIEISRLRANDAVGEVGIMLDTPRSATTVCTKQTYALQFDKEGFDHLMERVPGFARRLSRSIAERLIHSDKQARFPTLAAGEAKTTGDLVRLFPREFIIENHLIPLSKEGNTVTVGFVDPPSRDLAQAVRGFLGDFDLEVVLLRVEDFERLLRQFGLTVVPIGTAATPATAPRANDAVPLLEPIADASVTARPQVIFPAAAPPALPGVAEPGPVKLRRNRRRGTSSKSMVAQLDDLSKIRAIVEQMPAANASDLHIGAGEHPRWRIDGELFELPDYPTMESEEVLDLFEPLMPQPAVEEFNKHHDCDFSFSVEGVARFRANVFRDEHGVGAALRIIPMHVMSMEKLGIPKAARGFCDLHQGLILVCGPTGCGKSTTLAAMIDSINQSRRSHIITLEDPIEFVHTSRMSLVTQREVGKNTTSFTRGLRASLREDPDIVLVGELRDRESLELALQTAQTGHLVFGTLHTSTAIGTVDRIIDMFPVDQHNQVRSVLADQLKGVINQHLCKRIGGGRVAAFECLVGGPAVAACIRQGKNHQIETVMTTNRSEGHRYLNDDLFDLVKARAIEPLEALKHTDNRKDLRQRLGMPSA